MQFEKIAPYLKDPLVLIGFFLFLAFLFCRYVIKQGIVPALPPTLGFRILRTILLYGFILGLLLVALGFALKYREVQAGERAQAAQVAETRRKNEADLADRQKQEAVAAQRDVLEQKAQVDRLDVELNHNLAVADQLRKNTTVMVGEFQTLSRIVRTPGIKILPILFPEKNIDLTIPDDQSINNADQAMAVLGASGLLNDQLEMQKVTAVAGAISQTIQVTLSTVQSLQDPNGTRYVFSDSVWKGDQAAIEKVILTDLTPYQASYGDLELLRTNYDIVAQHFVEYLIDLQNFFDPSKHLITRDSLRKILATERYTESLLVTYTKALIREMDKIRSLRSKLSAQGHAPQV